MENSRTVGNNFKDQVYFYSGLLKEQYQNLPANQQNSLKLVVAAGGAGTSFFSFFNISSWIRFMEIFQKRN
jgi:hypothetical protein